MLKELLQSKIIDSEQITSLLCHLLLGVVEETCIQDNEFNEFNFPDSIIEFVIELLGPELIGRIQNKIEINDRIMSEVINEKEWISDQQEAFDFVLYHLKAIKSFEFE